MVSLKTPDSKTRLSLIHNPATSRTPSNAARPPVSWLISHLHTRGLLSQATPSLLLSALGLDPPAVPADGPQIPIGGKNAFERLTQGVGLNDITPEEYAVYLKSSRFVARDVKLLPGEKGLIVNGRIVGPIEGPSFRAADFKALEDYEFQKRAEAIWLALSGVAPSLVQDKYVAADVVSMAASVLAASQQPDPSEIGLFDAPLRPRQRGYEMLESEYTVFEKGDNSTALYHIAALVG